MPIPSQNEFLLPFLNLLSDGQTYTRSQIMFRLAKHFDISEEEAQDMSGHQFTLVSRVAWCDVHFCKAGLAEKRQHHSDSMQDEFRITTLGVRELNKRPEQFTVGYLQGFYRGRVHRGAGSDDTTSDAELLLYEAFEKLPESFTVLHAVKWFARDLGTVGEIDFLVAHPDYGVLVMEVKGGDINIQHGQWYSTSRSRRTNEIKDPCEQAERNRRNLGDWLRSDPRTRGIPFALFPAVALPDSRVSGHIRPDCPQDIFIDTTHLYNLERRLLDIFRYWQSHADGSNRNMGGRRAVDALVDLLVPTRKLMPRVADIFERERRKIEELTQQQFYVLKMLRKHRRAAIVGGAGTGKTMLAMEKAQQLADADFRVLFLCFNKNLATWLGRTIKQENITASTFHSLVGKAIHWARLPNVRPDEIYEKAADLLMDSVNIIRSPDSSAHEKLFDAIIVDEAQDFEDEWWIPLPDLLKDPEQGVFYVFFDDNQRLYTQISNIPMEKEPFYLSENCRNTRNIHESLQPYARTDEAVECNGPEGRPVERIQAADVQAARKSLQQVLHRLVNEEGIDTEDIVILTPASEKRSRWKSDEMLGNFVLTWNMDTTMDKAIRICTIYRYKGLESAVTILTEMDQGREEISDQLAYVGMSRARHHVVIIGELPEPQS